MEVVTLVLSGVSAMLWPLLVWLSWDLEPSVNPSLLSSSFLSFVSFQFSVSTYSPILKANKQNKLSLTTPWLPLSSFSFSQTRSWWSHLPWKYFLTSHLHFTHSLPVGLFLATPKDTNFCPHALWSLKHLPLANPPFWKLSSALVSYGSQIV